MRWLVDVAIVLAFCTIALGAYTRLTDAGLGCPDWPGCYGALVAPYSADQVAAARQQFPGAAVEPHKARNEMLHRYIAGCLGLVVLSIAGLSCWLRRERPLAILVLAWVAMQALLGMLTVSLNLLPLVVLGHLLGGFGLLSLLTLMRLRMASPMTSPAEPALRGLAGLGWLALLVLVTQVSLGVWTSANYAALVCHQLPFCEPGWQPMFDIRAAFRLPLGQSSYQYGVLSHEARLSIHILHRIGALVTLLVVGSFAFLFWHLAKTKKMQRLGLALAGLLALQICLGLINVIAFLPLFNAVAHTLVAASLLMMVTVCLYQLHSQRR